MHCHHCNRSFAEDALYCSQCGRRLHNGHREDGSSPWLDAGGSGEEAAALNIEAEHPYVAISGIEDAGAAVPKAKPRSFIIWNWLIGIGLAALAVAAAIVVMQLYQHEDRINEHVLKLQSEAKAAALSGKYEEALELLEEAAAARPSFAPLAADTEIIQHVLKVQAMAEDVEKLIELGNAREVEKALDLFKGELSGNKEPIYDKQREKLEGYNMKLTILRLTEELTNLSTVKQHGEMLNVVNGLIGEEAAALREDIVARIREITAVDAATLVGRKSFSSAIALVDQSLVWVKGDEELLALKEQIREDQSRYIRLEQQRIEQAMQMAAEEDLINQTAAVEVLRTEGTLDEFGDLSITGFLKNAATRPIYNVKVEYSVISPEGELMGKGMANVAPNYIEPGDEMSFFATVYGVYVDNTEIVIDHVTWYLD